MNFASGDAADLHLTIIVVLPPQFSIRIFAGAGLANLGE